MLTEIFNRILAEHKGLLRICLFEFLNQIRHPIGSGLNRRHAQFRVTGKNTVTDKYREHVKGGTVTRHDPHRR